MAKRYLQQKEYRILHTNWTCHWGEIDIVAVKDNQITFFEVKTRKKEVLETISHGKLKRLFRSAQIYLKKYGYGFSQFQVDFIGITTEDGRLIHFENVLEVRL